MTVLKLLILFTFIIGSYSQIPVFDLKVDNLLRMQQGAGWPHTLQVVEGHELLLKLNQDIDSPEACIVTTPLGLDIDVANPGNDRYSKWDGDCGVRVRNAVETDEGRWRLTALKGATSVTGWIEVYVNNETKPETAPSIALQDGSTNVEVSLTSLDNAYCLVSQPFSESSLISGQCVVNIDRTTRAVQGNWNVLFGIPGRVQELVISRQVAVESEHLDVGYIYESDTNKLHIYCNILHSAKNITFCRFQKTGSAFGFNVADGLSDGAHSYYGDGFQMKHCGMTIETPTSQDYGSWKCSVGVQQWEGTHLVVKDPMQALITVTQVKSRNIKTDADDTSEVRTVFVQSGMSAVISANALSSLSYCWFQHPNGSQFTPLPKTSDEQLFWYTSGSLDTGDCSMTLHEVTDDDEGLWTCHMGAKNSLGLEITDTVYLRVTGALAANQPVMSGIIGGSMTLHCHSSNGNRPLDYCRFITPNFVGFNLDSDVSEENAILGRYYFTTGLHLNQGDCALTIKSLESNDIGEWTCAAVVDGEIAESRDTILVQASRSRARAGMIGMSVAIPALLIVMVFAIAYKRYYPMLRKSTRNSQHSGANLPGSAYARNSTSSNGSDEIEITLRT